jgi:hypothetical protein
MDLPNFKLNKLQTIFKPPERKNAQFYSGLQHNVGKYIIMLLPNSINSNPMINIIKKHKWK